MVARMALSAAEVVAGVAGIIAGDDAATVRLLIVVVVVVIGAVAAAEAGVVETAGSTAAVSVGSIT
jgi:hypothetical protein